jgi:fructose-bisphosphate aldolase, class I
MEIWKGQESNQQAAQQALLNRVRCNRAARKGKYNDTMEKTQI